MPPCDPLHARKRYAGGLETDVPGLPADLVLPGRLCSAAGRQVNILRNASSFFCLTGVVSAHTFLPSSGNGATQAMEDATSLAACLALAARDTRSQGSKSAKANVPLAVRAHCAIRFHRVDSLQLFGFLNQFSRNKPDFEAIMKDPELVKMKISRWLVEHDAEVYAEESWAEIKRLVEEGRESEWVPTNVPKGYEYRKWTLDDMLAVGRGEKEVELVGDW